MNSVFIVLSHLEVQPGNFSTEVIKAFSDFESAHRFAGKLKTQIKPSDLPEEIEIEELTLVE